MLTWPVLPTLSCVLLNEEQALMVRELNLLSYFRNVFMTIVRSGFGDWVGNLKV